MRSSITAAALLLGGARAGVKDTATPQMGWNSYNAYNCNPNEAVVKENAQGLLDTGLAAAGYRFVTPDCGWNAPGRDAQGRLQWDTRLFPSGGAALGEFIHGLGLKFGLYGGGGYFQCGSEDLPASLGHEQIDAATYASWGGDSLKYDNCYSTSPTQMVDYDSAEAGSPTRFRNMAAALNQTSRDIVYQICQWGVGTNLGVWAPPLGNSFRISNDIINSWPSIWRITNQVVPFTRFTGPGAFPDMDMLIVGLGALNAEEERFHFTMWAINKSPLTIGCRVTAAAINKASLATMSNAEVIAINQDPLAKGAALVRRDTTAEWDLWAGPLSGDRLVVALANWNGRAQNISVNWAEALGIASAQARNVWAARDVGKVEGVYSASVPGHGVHLLVLSGVVKSAYKPRSAGYYAAGAAKLSGSAALSSCAPGDCRPAQQKIGNIGPNRNSASVSFSGVKATSAGRKLLGVDYINYDIALGSAWSDGTNTRNMTVSVNGGAGRRTAFPISGGSWAESGRLMVEADGFVNGANTVVLTASDGGKHAPDLVGFEVFEY
jgi:alpha-galactosidase